MINQQGEKYERIITLPFCGHKASVYQTIEEKSKFNPTFTLDGFGSLGYNTTTKKTKHLVRCNKCKASVGVYATEKQAIESWNKRIKEN